MVANAALMSNNTSNVPFLLSKDSLISLVTRTKLSRWNGFSYRQIETFPACPGSQDGHLAVVQQPSLVGCC